MKIEFDPFDPNEPTTIKGRIVFEELLPHLDGKTAGELRAMGFEIGEKIPDCAEARNCPGGVSFSWVSLEVVLKPDGSVEVSDEHFGLNLGEPEKE